MKFHVLTIFPEMFSEVFAHSIPRIAQEKGSLTIQTYDLRDWASGKHHKVDDTPYGGGPGMVLKCDCVFDAVESISANTSKPLRKLILTPSGRRFDQSLARELSAEQDILLICGRYEGFDQRIIDNLDLEEVSVGDYILSGGEIPAMAIIDAVTRLLPGVLGDDESSKQESFENGLLDYPVYTKPADFRGLEVPEILLSGHAAKIDAWRQEQALLLTQKKRKDLLENTAGVEDGSNYTN